jgi:hypothetical protein
MMTPGRAQPDRTPKNRDRASPDSPTAGAFVSVYVDDGFLGGDWGYWTGGGHMQADTLDELHAMAVRLGLRRTWFQSRPGRPWHDHYDLTRSKRDQALRLGAIAVTSREAAKRNRKVRLAHRAAADQRSAGLL